MAPGHARSAGSAVYGEQAWIVTYTEQGDDEIQRRRVRAWSAARARDRVAASGVAVIGVEEAD